MKKFMRNLWLDWAYRPEPVNHQPDEVVVHPSMPAVLAWVAFGDGEVSELVSFPFNKDQPFNTETFLTWLGQVKPDSSS